MHLEVYAARIAGTRAGYGAIDEGAQMTTEKTYDAIVLGAGPAGEVVAGRLADAGWKVAIVEKELIGGECSYWACMPSKALLRPADVLGEARRIPGVPVDEDSELDPAAILARRDRVIHWEGDAEGPDDSGQLPWLEERGIDLFRGAARFVGEGRIEVGDATLTASRAVIVATGSGAAMPPIEGLDSVRTWNNRDATTAKKVPASMVVLGGGPVGSELSQAWASLGTKVTLVDAAEHLLGREEPYAGDEVAAALRGRFGVDVRLGAEVESAREEGGRIVVELAGGGAVEGEELLVAVGRKPHTEGIGLDAIGVRPDDKGFLEVDDRMRVPGRDGLFAIGDVNGRALFTHVGKYQAWIVAENLLGREVAAFAESLGSPRVTFTDPQVAAVGKTLAAAEEAGIDARAVEVPTDGSPGASFQGKGTGGKTRLVVDRSTDTIVGATFTGFEVADFLQTATLAIVAEVPLARLRHAIAPYPTRSEVWLKLIEKWEAGED
jgi:pyruvate/2-oxoglutarate dehydrogenase complex dihydrolipoamide dehydrogenase (E3) component